MRKRVGSSDTEDWMLVGEGGKSEKKDARKGYGKMRAWRRKLRRKRHRKGWEKIGALGEKLEEKLRIKEHKNEKLMKRKVGRNEHGKRRCKRKVGEERGIG